MPENPLEQARFDHVDDAGNLVFAVGNLRFAVHVDDTLERAILEAKQIRSESGRPQPQTAGTLPISQIQALIRAGADPSKVAERYGLGEALVRRFSAAVETEKQYAIEQFLAVPAPKDSRMRTTAELIERTLATARIGMETLSWQATRRGLEPWRIVARFRSAGREVRAEWTWNMHDNAVVCVNAAAKQLFGLRTAGDAAPSSADTASADGDLALSLSLPGDSIRSARIERAVAQWGGTNGDAADPAGSMAVAPLQPITWRPGNANGSTTDGNDVVAEQPAASTVSVSALSPSHTVADHAASATQQQPSSPERANDGEQAGPSDGGAADARDDTGGKPVVKPAKRRSGRSAVPSWDEILFGE
ncbi:septation protein SepH [Bifidobacterium aerophilum]|uniref:DUF3071 domain-containing protein n=1 Tax=Bifidobacterium aerophilum TaxID=1798155 RepID=A0A6N9Z649_9BIFI|nr:septation protein SepH [Bifidobacterium aerophilum]NEG89595.1 DUF3071 domain-containing protein [Bifidobacterium aerophilum]